MNYTDNWNQIKELIKNIELPDETNEIFLFGAGVLGSVAVSNLKKEIDITAFCDNSAEKQGTVIEGLRCISPAELSQYQNPFVLISTCKYYTSIHRQLKGMGISHCSLDGYVVCKHFHEFKDVYSLLDDESKNIYSGVLLGRMIGNIEMIEQYYSPNQYFCFPKFRWLVKRDGVFVDCGAFVGDIVEDMVQYSLSTFKKIYAFEPNKHAFKALQRRGSFLADIWGLSDGQIVYEQKGVGARHDFLSFYESNNDFATSSLCCSDIQNSEENVVEIVVLDEYFANIRGGGVNIAFIKADIEGAEWDMLHGASETIQQCKPLIAVCIYRNIYDMYRIPLYLKKMVPEYKFHIRHHSTANEETVLYCCI